MYQRAITLQEHADLFDRATWTGAIRQPAAWIMSGEHPSFGAFTTIQDDDPDWITLTTQYPCEGPLPAA